MQSINNFSQIVMNNTHVRIFNGMLFLDCVYKLYTASLDLHNLNLMMSTYQTIQLAHWTLCTGLTNIPHFDATFPTSIHIFRWI